MKRRLSDGDSMDALLKAMDHKRFALIARLGYLDRIRCSERVVMMTPSEGGSWMSNESGLFYQFPS